MAWKRYRTETGAHVTLNYTADGLIELPAEPALDANGRPRPATYPKHIFDTSTPDASSDDEAEGAITPAIEETP